MSKNGGGVEGKERMKTRVYRPLGKSWLGSVEPNLGTSILDYVEKFKSEPCKTSSSQHTDVAMKYMPKLHIHKLISEKIQSTGTTK